MNYRPKGFKNPFDEECGTDGNLHIGSSCPHCIYEAGADAMFEGFKEDGEHFPAGFKTINFPTEMPAGYFVYIPDEELL